MNKELALSAKGWRSLVACSSEIARKRLSYEQACSFKVLPLSLQIRSDSRPILTLASEAALSRELEKAISFSSGCDVEAQEVGRIGLQRAIHSAYYKRARVNKDEPSEYLEHLLNEAHKIDATDIHISSCKVLFRTDGRLVERKDFFISKEFQSRVSRRVKVLSNLDTTTNAPLEGMFTWKTLSDEVYIRVSIVTTVRDEKVVLRRVLSNSSNAAPIDFGFSSVQRKLLHIALGLSRGAIILSGPTGSGKTTLLYEMVKQLISDGKHVVSIEEPVEKHIEGLTQCEASSSAGASTLLKHILRHDPDVIMIGEIRSNEMAKIAFEASLTGHLVLSTVHAANCVEVFVRLKDLGLSSAVMSYALRLVISQRLLPKVCQSCCELVVVEQVIAELFQLPRDTKVPVVKACQLCRQTGFLGRQAVVEMLPFNRRVNQLLSKILDENSAASLNGLEELPNYISFKSGLRQLLIQKKVSIPEALSCLDLSAKLFSH